MNLIVEKISKSYDKKQIISDISLNLKDGEVVSVIGSSGVGKTTLFNIISGLEKPDCGKVILNEDDITSTVGKLSYMLQKDLLLEYKTIIDNVSLPLYLNGKSKKEAKKIAEKYFKEFYLDGIQNKYPKEISGGMCQRAAFLRTYLMYKEVILLDEPFNSLDEITKTKMHRWLIDIIKRKHLSVLMVTHDIDEALFLSNRIYVMSGSPGKIVYELKLNKQNISNDLLNKENKDIILKLIHEGK